MPDKYWNYASSKDQQRQELEQMHKSMTDPEERQKARLLARREQHRESVAQDNGL